MALKELINSPLSFYPGLQAQNGIPNHENMENEEGNDPHQSLLKHIVQEVLARIQANPSSSEDTGIKLTGKVAKQRPKTYNGFMEPFVFRSMD